MGCGCNNKSAPRIISLVPDIKDPPIWGPILWKYFHSIAERLGYAQTSAINIEQVNYFISMLRYLSVIIPCRICQGHARDYIAAHPIPVDLLEQRQGESLRATARQWLFDFHTAVRIQNQQSVQVATIEECKQLYQGSSITNEEYSKFIKAVASAVNVNWVRLENWRKWYYYSEKLRNSLGNIITP